MVHLPVLPSLAVLVLLLALAAGVTWRDAVGAESLANGLHLLTAVLLPGAGLLCLVRWRMTGLTRPAFVGIGLLVLGVFGESLHSLTPLVYGAGEQPLPRNVTAAAAALASLWLFTWARRAPAIDAGARPGRILAGVALTVPLSCTAVVVWAAPLSLGATSLPVALPPLVVAVLWAAMTLRERDAGLDGRSPWLILVFGLTAGAAALYGLAAYAPDPAGVWAAVLSLCAGIVALHGAFCDVLSTLSAQSSRLLSLTVDVHDHEQQQLSARAQEEERLHEVRNVLAGLHGATVTLRKYEDRLEAGVRRRLEDAVSAELRRLAHILDPTQVEPVVDVDLDAVLGPVAVSELEQGADLKIELGAAAVRGRSADIATIVSALLVNARRHAPGTPVLLWAEAAEGEVRIHVEDRGPGVPLDQRQTVFERGERAGATAPGSGLGLYTARRLATEMGGTLQVDSRPGGGASFLLTLAATSGAGRLDQARQQSSKLSEVSYADPVRRLERRAVPRQRDRGARPDLRLATLGDDSHADGVLTGGQSDVDDADAVQVECPSDGIAQQTR